MKLVQHNECLVSNLVIDGLVLLHQQQQCWVHTHSFPDVYGLMGLWGISHGRGTPRWCNQMETFSALLALCARNSPVNSPHKGQWRGALMLSLICNWINSWVNNREASDLRHHHAHYEVIVMQNTEIIICLMSRVHNCCWKEHKTTSGI